MSQHYLRQVPPFRNPRIKACLAAPRGLSQLSTSFIASWHQGIHRLPLLTWPQNLKLFTERFYVPTYFYLFVKELFSTWRNFQHGGGERVRTDDLLRARQALSQLSYTPYCFMVGLDGVEPSTSRLSGVRSNQSELQALLPRPVGLCPV
jgi:hypothetical protein